MLYYAGLIEQWGSGIDRMVRECAAAGLPEPEFQDESGWLWVTFRKEWLTEERLRSLGLNERQLRPAIHVQRLGRITSQVYQQLGKVSAQTATRELASLIESGVLVQVGATGRGTSYVLKTPQTRQTRQERAENPPSRDGDD